MGYTKGKAECNKRYLANFKTITVRMTPEQKAEISRKASEQGKSINQYIIDTLLGS